MGDCPKMTPIGTLQGNMVERGTLRGTVKNYGTMSGYVRTGMATGGGLSVLFGLTEELDALQGAPVAGTILVYTDHTVIDEKPYPAIKVADGENIPRDLLFVAEGEFLSVYPQLEQLSEQFSSLADVAHSGSYNDLTNKPTIPTVPTNISAFINDLGYLVPADIAHKMEKHLLQYDGDKITDNGEQITFNQLYSLLMESNGFAVLVYNNYAYHPNGVSREQIVFRSGYPVNGLDVNHRITMLKNGTITQSDNTDENVVNKTDAITDLNKTSNIKYPTLKAVVDYLANRLLGYYTKTEIDEKGYLTQHQPLTDYVKFTDYASTDKAGVIKRGNWITLSSDGKLQAGELTKAQYDSASGVTFVGKTTLENVLTARLAGLASESFVQEELARQLALIDGNGEAY